MMYYKIICNGIIIDACDGLSTVRYQGNNCVWMNCPAQLAQGLVASDGGEIYLLQPMDGIEGRIVTYEEIDAETYAELREEIDAGRTVPEPEPEPEPDTPGKTRLAALEEAVDMLTECILEMSEIIYG